MTSSDILPNPAKRGVEQKPRYIISRKRSWLQCPYSFTLKVARLLCPIKTKRQNERLYQYVRSSQLLHGAGDGVGGNRCKDRDFSATARISNSKNLVFVSISIPIGRNTSVWMAILTLLEAIFSNTIECVGIRRRCQRSLRAQRDFI